MGTNYYLQTRNELNLHIGKSSSGWVFSLRVHPSKGINNFADWLPLLIDPDHVIVNEYQDVITAAAMIEIITCRKRAEPLPWTGSDWSMNNAVQGPNNLARHNDAYPQITHGEGTWDTCDYEFC